MNETKANQKEPKPPLHTSLRFTGTSLSFLLFSDLRQTTRRPPSLLSRVHPPLLDEPGPGAVEFRGGRREVGEAVVEVAQHFHLRLGGWRLGVVLMEWCARAC